MSAEWWHDTEEFQRRLNEAGGWEGLARATGTPATTWKGRGRRAGIKVVTGHAAVAARVRDSDPVLVKRLQDANKRIRELESGKVSDELFLRRLENEIRDNVPRFVPVKFKPVAKKYKTAQEMVLLWSDLHAAETVALESTAGINEYSWDVMLDRMNETQQSVFSHAEHQNFKIERLTVAMLGDMLSGFMHDELVATNDRPVAQAVVDLAYDHAPWLVRFADWFGQVHVACVPGNHPRFAFKPSYKEYFNNNDWLFYKLLEAILADDKRITFDIPRSAWNLTTLAERWRVLLMHGDGIRTTMPGVPWGGVIRRVTTIETQMHKARTPLDFVFMGHWHSKNSLDGVNSLTFVNGSVKGADEYALAKFGSGHDAAQTLLTFHPSRGWTGQYAINLQDVMPAGEGWD